MKKTYNVNWGKLINKFNERNIGQLTQARLAEVLKVTPASLSYDTTLKRKKSTLDKYRPLYELHFEKYVPFEELLIEYETYD